MNSMEREARSIWKKELSDLLNGLCDGWTEENDH